MKTIVLNGIGWDTENLAIEGKTHFTYKEALQIAKDSGKRLPTKKEFEELLKLPHLWDDDRHGMWFAEREEDLKTEGSLFLPAMGFSLNDSTTIYDVGTYGGYWSATPNGTDGAYYVVFYSTFVSTYYSHRYFGFAVRCVSE